MEITDAINHSIDRVMDFYDKRGVPLGYRPTFEYVNKLAFFEGTKATCKPEDSYKRTVVVFQIKNLMQVLYREQLDLNISDDAFLEAAESFVEATKIRPTDISYFSPIKSVISSEQSLDVVTAHEMWHLIEVSRGVLENTPYLCEGTAAYAQTRFANGKIEGKLGLYNDLFDMFYRAGALLVQRELEFYPNPYPLMLGEGFRVPLNTELSHIAAQSAVYLSRITLAKKAFRKKLAESLKKEPNFERLVRNLTRDGLIEAYRGAGARKLADELEGQDLNKLIGWFRFGGF